MSRQAACGHRGLIRTAQTAAPASSQHVSSALQHSLQHNMTVSALQLTGIGSPAPRQGRGVGVKVGGGGVLVAVGVRVGAALHRREAPDPDALQTRPAQQLWFPSHDLPAPRHKPRHDMGCVCG